MKCPHCGYTRTDSDNDISDYECPKCGIIYAKYKNKKATTSDSSVKNIKTNPKSQKGLKNKIRLGMIGALILIIPVFSMMLASQNEESIHRKNTTPTSYDTNSNNDKPLDMDVFGITFGEPLPDFENCFSTKNGYDICKQKDYRSGTDGIVHLRLSLNNNFHTYLEHNTFNCQIVDGKVEIIYFIIDEFKY